MLKHLTLLITILLFSIQLNSQTVFWSDNFDAPSGGANNNNAGAGWSASTNTPGGGQNTSFLGFSNSWIIGNNAGACSSGNKVYIKSIGNGNAYVSDVFTDKLIASPSISTVGQSQLFLSFIWRCDGVANQDYGQVGLSTDNGTTWNWLPQQYSGQETCTSANLSLSSQYEGITSFKFAFRFISNATSCSTCDPPFNIDNIQLLGEDSNCDGPEVDPGEDTQFCLGSSPVSIGGAPTAFGGSGNYSYAWSPASGLSSTTVANPLASPNNTTTYSVLVTDLDSGCSASEEVTVDVVIPQNLTISLNGSTNICPGESLTLTAASGFTNYVWSTPGGNQSGAAINATAAGAYSVTATSSSGCTSSSSVINLTISTPQPINILPLGSTTICQGNSVTLNVTTGFTNYTWTTPDGNQSGASVNASTAGVYSVTATGSNGCISTSSEVNISVNTPQQLTTNPAGAINTCSQNPVTITATPGFTGYSWSTPSGIQTGSSVDAINTGSYTVSAFDANGCLSSSGAVNLSVFNPITLSTNPSGNLTICEGSQINLTASPGFTGLIWSTPTGTLTGNSINVSDAGSYSVSGNDANGCATSSNNVIINVNTPQQLSISPSGNITICEGETTNLTATSGFTNYVWTTPTGNSNGAAITASAEGEYSVTATDNNSCSSTSEIINLSIQSTVSLPVTPSGPLSFCEGESVILNAATGFTNYNWNGNPGTAFFEVLVAGDYTATAISASGCQAISEVISVTENQAQTLSISPQGSLVVCTGESIELSAGSGFSNYNWLSPTGNISGQTINASTEGEYSVSAIDNNGCASQSLPVSISVVDPIPMVTFPEGTVALCPGESVTLATATIFTDYVWTSASFTGTGQVIEVDLPGLYSVTAIDENGCTTTSQPIDVQAVSLPALNVSPAGPIFRCPNLSITLTASQGFTNYVWTPGNVEGNSYTAIDAGSYTASATSPEGCVVTSNTVQFNFYPNPPFIPVTPAGPLTLCPGENVLLTAGTGFTQYLWNTNNTGLTLNVQTAGNYVVTANDSNGCAANSQSIPISLDPLTPIEVNPSGDIFICSGEDITLTAQAGFTNYVWSNKSNATSITVDEPNSYSVTGINSNGCDVSSESVNLFFQELPTAQFEYLQQNGYNVDFENTSQNATSFFWEFNGSDTSLEENPSYDFLFDNMWPVSLIACNDCGCDTLNTLVDVVKTGILETISSNISISQEANSLLIQSLSGKAIQATVYLYNLLGQELLNEKLSISSTSLVDISSLSKGVYLVKVQEKSGSELVRKIYLH